MSASSDGQSYWIPARIDCVLKTLRSALAEVGLSIVREIDVSGMSRRRADNGAARSTILLVDSALLTFEAVALDRAGAVFMPLHVLVSSSGEGTDVFVADPVDVLHLRTPVGAGDPMKTLLARVAMAVESAAAPAGRPSMENSE
jgi:uncharacterized protein (DUF302 family)